MKYGSVCSGIEAATAAWHPLGWEPAWFAEIEPFPSAVLAHHYPEVPNYGDFTHIRDNDHPADRDIDLLVGGTPCQSFSISGLRGGLDDDRGQLALEFMRLVGALRPRWVVWENVPGVLSSNGGRDFGSILGALAELGYGFAYRVLDAQHFGVPQRRRRVFLVGHSGGDSRRPAAVLFEPEGVYGDSAPSRETRQDTSDSAGDGLARCVSGTIDANIDRKWGSNQWVDAGMAVVSTVSGDIAHTLSAEGADASEDGTGRGTPAVGFGWQEAIRFKAEEEMAGTLTKNQTQAVAFSSKDYGADAAVEMSPTLRSGNHSHSHANGGAPPAVAFSPPQGGRSMPVTAESPTLEAGTGNKTPAVLSNSVVRRLTPVECSRLQGFPDTYLETRYANASEAHAAQVLHLLWREAGTSSVEGQEWRTGISAALLTPQILLAGVHGGWLSWSLSARCAASRGALPGESFDSEEFVRELRRNAELGRSPYRRKSFEQLARQLGCSVSELPLENAQASAVLRGSGMWSEAQRTWPLRYALATRSQVEKDRMSPDGPRYKALGNSMAVPVMRWIGQRIETVDKL